MSYESLKSAAREAAKSSDQVREAVRLGFEMNRDLEAKQRRISMSKHNHHSLSMAPITGLTSHRQTLGVWDDDQEGGVPHVTLHLDQEASYVSLLPNEARALAHLLIAAADGQDRRANSWADVADAFGKAADKIENLIAEFRRHTQEEPR